MTVKSTIIFVKNLTVNVAIHDSTPGTFNQYLRSFLASLKSRKKSMSPTSTAAVITGLTTARSAMPNSLTPTWHAVKSNIEANTTVLGPLLLGTYP